MKRLRRGFTFIEILVSMTVLLVVTGITIAGYSNFNNSQLLKQTAATLKNDLRAAGSNATNGIKPDGCDTFVGYKVAFASSAQYTVTPSCQNDSTVTYASNTHTLPNGVTFTPIPQTITFFALDGGASPEQTIILSNASGTTAKISIFLSGLVQDFTVVATPTPSDATNNGLQGDYFGDTNLSYYTGSRNDPNINYDWGTSKPYSGLFSPNNYSVRWTGSITIPKTGTYTFYLDHQDGARLFIDDMSVPLTKDSQSWKTGARVNTVKKSFTGGVHAIKVEMYKGVTSGHAILSWSLAGKGGFAKKVVEKSVLTLP